LILLCHNQLENSSRAAMRNGLYRVGKVTGVLVFASLLGLQSAIAEVYKFTDKDGIVHYTNVRPSGQGNVQTFSFPCYASDPKCNQLDWEKIPLNRRAFNEEIQAAAEVFAVDDALIRAIIHAESAYQPDALSPKGALMYLIRSVILRVEHFTFPVCWSGLIRVWNWRLPRTMRVQVR